MKKGKKENSRRKFLSDLALGSIGTMGAAGILTGYGAPVFAKSSEDGIQLLDQAPDGKPLKAGLIGCGGRGTGAAVNFVDAGPNLEITALGDVFQSKMDQCRHYLNEARGIKVPDENCFIGFDSYEKVIDSGVDVVLLAAPQYFRPAHVDAAVEAGKHIFQEKPIAVDPVGARWVMESTEKAKQKKLCMVSGTIRRYQKDYMETHRRVANGEIGDITSANIIRNGRALWWVPRQPGWSDMEYMLHNWGNYNWLSGDFIVDQFIHEIDVMSWHIGEHPRTALGYGGRHQRNSGDQYDHFSIVYDYGNGLKTHCATRQINGCDTGKQEFITGTKGYASCNGTLYNHNGEIIWEYPYPDDEDSDQRWRVNNPYVQEHVELVTAIRTGNYLNDSDEQIKSTLMTIMARMTAYTGRIISWEEVLNSDMKLGPEKIALGPAYDIPDVPPAPGSPPTPTDR